jgi:hypothetical protein
MIRGMVEIHDVGGHGVLASYIEFLNGAWDQELSWGAR